MSGEIGPGGGAAFPHDNLEFGDRHLMASPGMSMQDWYAGQVINGLLSNPNVVTYDPARQWSIAGASPAGIAEYAAAIARAMVNQSVEARRLRSQ